MSPERIIHPADPAEAPRVVPLHPEFADGNGGPPDPPRRVRVKKLRVLGLLVVLGLLAAVSTVFGMMMAVASDLPALEEPSSQNSVMVDRRGTRLGLLTGNQNRILLNETQIAPFMKQAVIAIEDKRFLTNDGVDLRGIGRALYQDVVAKRAVQGGSTITQQFVKNALAAQNKRTLFVKLREAALAYHLTRRWSKQKILRNYLNTIYFGNGAYGIESAARTYFASRHPGCEQTVKTRPCASQLKPEEAALLAGMVASPSGYDPIAHPQTAQRRRDLVLARMYQQHLIAREQYDLGTQEAIPTRRDIRPPREDTRYPYFTSWVKQQVVDKLGGGQTGARQAFEGGLTVQTTLDSRFQDAANAAVQAWLPNLSGPRVSLVAIDNRNGEVRAMVGGDDYNSSPFNLATQGQRQPGSAFKPFVLAEGLKKGFGPGSLFTSKKKVFKVKGSIERFTVENYNNAYAGTTTLANATAQSDNSVFAELGVDVGTAKVARLARRMGIRTPVSHNLAISLGGLHQGVTPLDMAHAYETFARGGRLIYGSMSPGRLSRPTTPPVPGPVGIHAIGRTKKGVIEPIKLPNGKRARNQVLSRRVLPESVAGTVQTLLQGVVKDGTGKRAAILNVPVAGKTGTTENYSDAWFVGWTPDYTVAVWVGYPKRFQPMTTEFAGKGVAGGTYPAEIWKTFMDAVLKLDPPPGKKLNPDGTVSGATPDPGVAVPTTPAPSTPAAPVSPSTPAPTTGGGKTVPSQPAPTTPKPQQTTPAKPAPAPAQDPATGGGTSPPGGGAAPPPG